MPVVIDPSLLSTSWRERPFTDSPLIAISATPGLSFNAAACEPSCTAPTTTLKPAGGKLVLLDPSKDSSPRPSVPVSKDSVNRGALTGEVGGGMAAKRQTFQTSGVS